MSPNSVSVLSHLRVGVVGGGIAGAAAALLLGRLGAQVTLFEQVEQPRAVGAGILLQPTGLSVLRAIDPLIEGELEGARIVQLLGHNPQGRVVLDSQYRHWNTHKQSAWASGGYGMGIHRGALFDALWRRIRQLPHVTIQTGTPVGSLHHRADRVELSTHMIRSSNDSGLVAPFASAQAGAGFATSAITASSGVDDETLGAFDLVVVAEGVRSQLRGQLNIPCKAKPYPWGALWSIMPLPADWPTDLLLQRYRAARQMAGVLPMGQFGGRSMASLFWSMPTGQLSPIPAVDAFKQEVLGLWPELEGFLSGMTEPQQLAAARYADVVMPHWHDGRVVVIGDAAHAMSPQLGQGATMGLIDAYVLARRLLEDAHVPTALMQYSQARCRHLKYYQWASRWLTPLFQSDRKLAPWMRDGLMGYSNWVAPIRRFGAHTLVGVKSGWFRRDMDLNQIRPFE